LALSNRAQISLGELDNSKEYIQVKSMKMGFGLSFWKKLRKKSRMMVINIYVLGAIGLSEPAMK
jgi:hypothetical protein